MVRQNGQPEIITKARLLGSSRKFSSDEFVPKSLYTQLSPFYKSLIHRTAHRLNSSQTSV